MTGVGMWLKWLPWRLIVSRLARSRGFIDPIAVLSRVHRFAEPSEVTEPIELLRAGVVFHARGLINARAIQHNLDWVWPFWIERQFDPADVAFVPRAFSITHVNLTHRNWTAVGLPELDWLPIVDPRGLVTPVFDGWSIDAWVIPDQGEPLLPSRAPEATQRLVLDEGVAVHTSVRDEHSRLHAITDMTLMDDRPHCRLRLTGTSAGPGWMVVALRPMNPEGVGFIHDMARVAPRTLRVNDDSSVHFDRLPERVRFSTYRQGDVLQRLTTEPEAETVRCRVGLATAAAMYRLERGASHSVTVRVPLSTVSTEPWQRAPRRIAATTPGTWAEAMEGVCTMEVPDAHWRFLFDAASRSLVLHSPGEVYPGPYTYRRFWFRDGAFMLHALLALGMRGRVRRAIERFPQRQTRSGYFRSQEGEWDANGHAIWIMDRYHRLTGDGLSPALIEAVEKGARWIEGKRLSEHLDQPHAGLMPAGFSAEHLGPNDYYYWDDFWSVAGLRSAAALLRAQGEAQRAHPFEDEAGRLLAAIERSLAQAVHYRQRPAIAASPYRRLDAGAVGSLAASYPLGLWEADAPRLMATVEFLLDRCMVRGGFFQDMIHSGVNAYLTLHLAQVLLRAGDERHLALVRAVAAMASETGQWPEAIHPHTHGGCMGDGQHLWAAAEWVLMMRALFVQEADGRLILGAGLPRAWLRQRTPMKFGPTPTPFGSVSVEVVPGEGGVRVRWTGVWRGSPPRIEVRLPGLPPCDADGDEEGIEVAKSTADDRRQETAR